MFINVRLNKLECSGCAILLREKTESKTKPTELVWKDKSRSEQLIKVKTGHDCSPKSPQLPPTEMTPAEVAGASAKMIQTEEMTRMAAAGPMMVTVVSNVLWSWVWMDIAVIAGSHHDFNEIQERLQPLQKLCMACWESNNSV